MGSKLVRVCKWSGSPVTWLGVATVVAVVLLLAVPAQVVAQDHEQHEATGEKDEAAGEEHHFHKNHFAVFIGSTEGVEQHGEEHEETGHDDGHGAVSSEGSSGGKDDPDFTIGFDYERRLTRLIGIGGMVDFVVEGRREFLLGPIGFLHPFGGAELFAAPLVERIRETGDWEFVFRVGVAWQFEVGEKFTVGPYAGYDISEEHEIWVLGVAIGRGF